MPATRNVISPMLVNAIKVMYITGKVWILAPRTFSCKCTGMETHALHVMCAPSHNFLKQIKEQLVPNVTYEAANPVKQSERLGDLMGGLQFEQKLEFSLHLERRILGQSRNCGQCEGRFQLPALKPHGRDI